MKIGLLTYHWVANFGANLQALSTINNIKINGHEPIMINWIPEKLEKAYSKCISLEQSEAHKDFNKQNFPLSKLCRNSKDISSVIEQEKIDLVIIGSDAVFSYQPFLDRFALSKRYGIRYIRPNEDRTFPNPFWGDFLNYIKVPVAIMSASAQNSNYKLIFSKKRIGEFNEALEKFVYVSVRDVWTQEMIKKVTYNNLIPKITPDPVFAFNYNVSTDVTKQYIINKYNLPANYILLSVKEQVFNSKWVYSLKELFLQKGIELITFPSANNYSTFFTDDTIQRICLPLPVLDWYYLIKYSQGYIGELMHPIIVSLHNANPFYSIDTYGFANKGKLDVNSSKIYQILNRFNLLNNMYNPLLKIVPPTPMEVYEKIINFDKDKCLKIAYSMYLDYSLMMNEIYRIKA